MLLAGLTAFGAACSSTSHNAGPSGSTGAPTSTSPTTGAGGSTTAPPTTPAPSSLLGSALTGAYQAETGALATYRNVVSSLGAVGPFPNIVSAEQQHVSTVSGLLSRYGMAVPAAGTGQASPATLRAACSLGVTVEQQVVSMYGDQLPKVSSYPDVTTAFQTLQAAARDNHLPAFQRCA